MRLAERQQGNVTTAQLREHGLSADAIAYRRRLGRLHREHRGVYSIGRPARTALERASAAVLACGPGALLSHDSALALWDLRPAGWPSRLEVTVTGDRRPPGILVHRSRTLSHRDVRRRHGIRVTSPVRALLDCGPRLSERALTRAVNAALRSPHCTPAQLSELLWRCPHHPSAARLAPFVDLADGPTRSELEDDFLAFCQGFGLPRPQVNTRVGRYEVDAYFQDARVIVELDGWSFHRDHDAFERDRDRDADALAAGIGTVRITAERLERQPQREAERLREILARGERD